MADGLWHTEPRSLPRGSLCTFSDVLISGGLRNEPWGTFMSSDWSMALFYFYFPHVSATLQPLIACDCGGCFVCVLVVLLLVWLGFLRGWVTVCGGCAGWWRREGSEDRTSLREVAVNPWPRWLSLQGGSGWGGGGGRPRSKGRLVQGHMMVGRGGGEVSNLVFVYEAFPPPPPSFLWEQSLRGRTMSKGSDLFYEPFKRGGGPPQWEGRVAMGSKEYHGTQSHVCLQVSALLFWPP